VSEHPGPELSQQLELSQQPEHSTRQPTADEYRVLAERLEHIRMLAGHVETPQDAADRKREVIAALRREREDDALRTDRSRFQS
jgi:hypothetical protein